MTNNVDILTRLVEREPRTDVYAACLIDALIEERGMLHTEASKYVDLVRRYAQTAADIAFTADLLARRGQAWHALLQEVDQVAKLSGFAGFILYVTAGSNPPSLMDGDGASTFPETNSRVPVRLPATWVREWHDKTRHPLGNELRKNAARPRRVHVYRAAS